MAWQQIVIPVLACIAAVSKVIYDMGKEKDAKLSWLGNVLLCVAIITLGFESYNKNVESTKANERHQELKDTLNLSQDPYLLCLGQVISSRISQTETGMLARRKSIYRVNVLMPLVGLNFIALLLMIQ